MGSRGSQAPGDRNRRVGRGQSTVIGIVLLIGIVAAGAVGVLAIGGDFQDHARDGVNREKVEQTFRQLDKDVDSVARSAGRYREVDFELPVDADSAVRQENAGRVVIVRQGLTNSSVVVNETIGSLVYDRDDVHYAYQAGAVWSGEGNETQLVSAPDIVYATTPDGEDPTLTMPITELEGPSRINTGGIEVRKLDTRAPVNDVSTVENQVVRLTITSDYYVGWGQYFEDRYENVVVSYDHDERSTTVILGQRDIVGDWDETVSSPGEVYVGTGSPSTGGPIVAPIVSGDLSCGDANVSCTGPESREFLDSVIETLLDRAASNYDDVSSSIESGDTLTAGRYYSDGFELSDGETLTIDAGDGNVSLYVEGPIGLSGGSIEVVDADQNSTCCYARLYLGGGERGDVAIDGGESAVNTTDSDAKYFQLYGTSEMHFAMGQANGAGFSGVVYAPRDDPANGSNTAVTEYDMNSATAGCSLGTGGGGGDTPGVCIGNGDGTFGGSIVGFHAVSIEQSSRVAYDPSLEDTSPTIGQVGIVPPDITFLQVSVNEVCVGDTDCGTT